MEHLRVPQLKEILKFLKLPSSGTKGELKLRIDEQLIELQLSFDELIARMEDRNPETDVQDSESADPDNYIIRNEASVGGVTENTEIVLESQSGQNTETDAYAIGNRDEVQGNHPIDNLQQNFNVVESADEVYAGRHLENQERNFVTSLEDSAPVVRHQARNRSRSVASSVSGGSINSSASAMERRREAAVKFAKMKASKAKRIEMIKREAEKNLHLQLLQAEIEDVEVEAEEEVWRNIEQDNVQGLPEIRRPRAIADDIPIVEQRTQIAKVHVNQDKDPAPQIRRSSIISDEPDLREVLSNAAARRAAGMNGRPTFEEASPVTCTNDVLRELVKCKDRSMLPKRNIEVFGGIVERFLIFKTAFESAVGSFDLSKREKLHYLYQYTEGTPRDLVESCLYMRESVGYDRAWSLLNKRYGSSQQIGSAHIQRVLAYPDISRDDPKALDQYAIALVMTDNAVSQLEYGSTELDNPQTIRQIVSKLPYNLQDRWRRIATDVIEKESRSVQFKDVLGFIDGEATIANNPLYGKLAMKASIVKGSNTKRAVVGTIQEILKCMKCGGKHEVQECHEFQALTHDQKINILRQNNCCFLCLSIGHMIRQCIKPSRCKVCNGWHNTILHVNRNNPLRSIPYEKSNKKYPSNYYSPRGYGQGEENQESSTGGTHTIHNTNGSQEESGTNIRMAVMSSCGGGPFSGRMCIVPVMVEDKNGNRTKTFALLDNGSAVTLCSRSLMERLGMHKHSVPTANLTVVTLGGECVMDGAFIDGLVIRNADDPDEEDVPLPPVYVVNKIPIDSCDAASRWEVQQWDHLSRLDVKEVGNVEMIIGANSPLATEPLEVISAPIKGQPYALRTRLGWIACGITGGMKNNVKIGKISMKDAYLNEQVNRAFDIGFDDIGSVKIGLSGEDYKWLQIVENGCKKIKGKYEIPLPIRPKAKNLPPSKGNAYKRLASLKKKLENNLELSNRYVVAMNEMIGKGYAEEVPLDELSISEGLWYIPHFPVTNPMKPNKVRVVFDCAARVKGVCLNDILLTGPCWGNELLDVLLRFREGRHAYTADIEAMYYQVKVPPSQRNYLRFFWWKDFNDPSSLSEFRMTVHLFGACSSPSVATYALRRASRENTGFSPDTHQTINKNFYVDDCMKSSQSISDLKRNMAEVVALCDQGGFRLTKHRSTIERADKGFLNNEDTIKTLGVTWNIREDSLKPSFVFKEKPKTRRQLLSTIASIYDPLGILAPCVLTGRIMLQESFRGKLGWDAEFTVDMQESVRAWVDDMENHQNDTVPRNILPCHSRNTVNQLHLFSDASLSGHGAVAYLRIVDGQHIQCRFIWGKARVNPLKQVSVPRLELVAAVLASQMKERLVDTLNVKVEAFIWTDSMTVLRYLRNERDRFNTFVANRVTIIKERTNVEDWRYISSKSNPADEASRGIQSARWGGSPEFLLKLENEWPSEMGDDSDDNFTQLELRTAVHAITAQIDATETLLGYFSCWKKLKISVAWWMEYKRVLKVGGQRKLHLTVSDADGAGTEIVRYIQRKYYKSEIEALNAGKSLKKRSTLWRLDPFMDDGILRVGGRLRLMDATQSSKHPVVLPSESPVAKLIVTESHERLGHLGAGTVLADLRQTYWITKGHAAVKRFLRSCVPCRKIRGQVLQQKMSDLPVERLVSGEPPFTNTGVDCFGPFHVKVGRREERRYGVLFTCMSMRAIHLEVAHDLSTDSMCNAIRRFIARRGQVRRFLSDNGTNFVGARREMISALSSETIRKRLFQKDVEWVFNPPSASHFGGAWERLIRIVRRVLESSIRNQCLSDDGLRTLLCEAELSVNSRPLSVITSDANEWEVITPNKLLTLGTCPERWGETMESESYSRKRWKHVQRLADQFWRKWCQEYRAALQERRKWTNVKRNVQIDDVVLLVNENEARCHWPLGRVVRAIKGRDGLIRTVDVLTRGKIYNRPISKLVMIIENEDLL